MDPKAQNRSWARRDTDRRCEGATGTPRRAEAGFTLLALVVAVAVINILLGVALARWSFSMKRHREVELIWRGEKYAEALDCYIQRQGAPPTRLEQLVEERCIRRLYRDPVSDSGEWRILRVADTAQEQEGEAEGRGGLRRGSRPLGGTVSRSGRGLRARLETEFSLSRRRSPEEMSADRSSLPDRTSLRERLDGRRHSGEVGSDRTESERATAGRSDLDGIVGVVSTSDAESIRSRSGGSRYSDWRFTIASARSQMPMLPGLSARRQDGSPEEQQEEVGPSRTDRDRGLRARARQSSGAGRR